MLSKIIQYLPNIRKAIAAGVAAATAVWGGVQPDGVTWWEWGYVAATAIGAGLLAWAIPNAGTSTPPTSPEAPPSV